MPVLTSNGIRADIALAGLTDERQMLGRAATKYMVQGKSQWLAELAETMARTDILDLYRWEMGIR